MTFINAASEDGDEAVTGLYQADRDRLGFVANDTKLLARRPDVLDAWLRLSHTISSTMDPRRFELATFAAARALRSSYCSLAHGQLIHERYHDIETTRQLAVDHREAGLDPVDVAVMDLADQVARDAGQVDQRQVDRLRELGLSDDEILDVVLTAAARCFFAKLLDATGTRPDAAYRETVHPRLRDVLTVGRPIADE